MAAIVMVISCSSDAGTESPLVSPAVTPGGLAVGELSIDGTIVSYVTVVPDGFEAGGTAPVLVAFPPGGQDLALTRAIVEGTYLSEAVTRGWVVVSPAAPEGQLYFNGSEALVPALLDWIESWVTLSGGRLHLAGISNGGISAFRVAGQNPDRFQSILVFPGFPSSDADREALADLAGVPVRIFVGEQDTGWIGSMEQTRATLADLGGDVTLEIVPDEGHVIRSLSDGVRIFDELDALR